MARLPDDETLMAYVDGALPEAEMLRIAALMEVDPGLRARLLPFELTRTRLPDLIGDALGPRTPDRLIATVMTAPIGTAHRAPISDQPHPSRPSLWQRLGNALLPEMPAFAGAFALAASVALIAGAGFMAARLVAVDNAGVTPAALNEDAIAAGPLAQALETVASGSAMEAGLVQVTPLLTVRDSAGRFCRQYALKRAASEAVQGFACRADGGRWTIAVHMPADAPAVPAEGSDYQPASGEASSALEQFIDRASTGSVITGSDEADLITKGWPRN